MRDLSRQRFDNYYLIRQLGKGTYGTVYLAEDVLHKELVAIKILHAQPDLKATRDFIKEVRVSRLFHPNIAHIRDFGIKDDISFIVMDYIPHDTLRHRHPIDTPVPHKTVVKYVKDIAAALQHIHNEGWVHRDVKPENLLIGENDEILLTDFGVVITSYTLDPSTIQNPIGTITYIAPEQMQGQAVRASDQYSLAIIVYEWLTGTPPFDGNANELMYKHTYVPPPPLHSKAPSIPLKVEQVVMKALSKNPRDRFASISEFAEALEQACQLFIDKDIFIYSDHTDGVRTTAWSPNGMYVASAGNDETVQVWNATTGHRILTYRGHFGEVWSVDWSPDGMYIASAGDDKTVQVWNATTGTRLLRYEDHQGKVRAIAWSPKGMYIASVSDDGTIQVWESMTGKPLWSSNTYTDYTDTVAWSPDAKYIATGGKDGIVKIWDVATALYVYIYREHASRVTSVGWSPDGKYIASASDDTTAQVWKATTGNDRRVYSGHSKVVDAIAWSPDGAYIATGSWDTTVHIWKATTGEVHLTYSHTDWVHTIAWSPDSRRIASGSWDKTVKILSL